MCSTVGIVEAGTQAGWGKAARKLGHHSLLELVVRRVTDCQQLASVVVLAADEPERAHLAGLVPPDVPILCTARRDMLGRFAAAAATLEAAAVVRVCADNPFIDPVLIDRLVTTADAHPECDYISYRRADGRPAIASALGMFAEWCTAAALKRADAEARSPADRAHVTRYLYSHPEKFQLRFLPVPPELDHDFRFAVDNDEAWEHAQTIFDALGPEGFDWRRIAGLLRGSSDLAEPMAVVDRDQA